MFELGKWRGTRRCRIVLPPCPSYDVEGTESWLSDMERAGWRLTPEGFFGGLARFERAEPCAAAYRLDAAPKARKPGRQIPRRRGRRNGRKHRQKNG